MKRFNYTGRKKIARTDVAITLFDPKVEEAGFTIKADLDRYRFQKDAGIFVEAQDKNRFERFEISNTGRSSEGARLSLKNFDDTENLVITLKVVEPKEGRLLGIAKNLKTVNHGDSTENINRVGILPVVSSDLSGYGVLWRIAQTDNSATLHIEARLGSRDQIVRSVQFKGFILPAAMRTILERIIRNGWDTDLTDSSELSTQWLLFVKQLGQPIPGWLNSSSDEKDSEFDNDLDEWLDEAVRLLSNQIDCREKIIDEPDDWGWK